MLDSVSNVVTAATGNATAGTTVQPRLVKAAHEFEASMMNELLKPLQSDPLFSEDGEDQTSGSGGALASFSSESLGRALSEHGGFGIAKRILDHFSSQPAEKSTTSNQNSSPLQGGNL